MPARIWTSAFETPATASSRAVPVKRQVNRKVSAAAGYP